MRRFLRLIIVFFSAAIVLLGLSVTVFAVPLQRPLSSTTWTVGGTCGTTIQACINVASNGDTVLIPAGTYNEHLALNGRTITLTGSGAATTIVRVPSGTYEKPLAINGGSPTISDLTLTGGNAGAGGGGGMTIQWGAMVTLKNVTVTGNKAGSAGGGIYISTNASLVLAGVIITGNQTTSLYSGGSGLVMGASSGPVQMTNVLIADNPDSSGGGQVEVVTSTLTIVNTTIANSVLSSGAGVLTIGGTAVLTNTLIANQTTGIQNSGGSLVENYNLFFGNTTDKSGAISGGVNDVFGDPVFDNPASGDYHLFDTSAAIDKGTNAGVTTDIDDDARPFGAGYDIGFDEHQIPAITITTPSLYQAISGTQLLISGLTNLVDQIPQVEISTDNGGAWAAAVGTTTWAYTWTVPYEDHVDHSVRVRVTDRTHNTTWSTPLTITVDRVPPQMAIDDPVLGQVIHTHAYTLTGSAIDGSGLANVEVSVNNGAAYSATTPTSSWSWPWPIPDENGVSHLLRVRATDLAGNVSNPPATIAVFVDNVPPTMTFSNLPIGGVTTIYSDTFKVLGTSIGALTTTLDSGSGPARVNVTNDVFSRTLTGLITGTYTLHGVAVDEAGNTTAITSTLIVTPYLPTSHRVFLPLLLSNFDPARDQYEPDDTYQQAKPIPADGTLQHHNFYPTGDVDWARLDVDPGTYFIATSGLAQGNTYPDTVMALYASNGTTLLSSNDDCSPTTRAACITWTTNTSSTLYVKVWPYDATSVGPNSWYDLSVVKQ